MSCAQQNNQYSEYVPREEHLNYSQSLWNVNDDNFNKKGTRFMSEVAPYIEATTETGMGPFEGARIPEGLTAFVDDLTKRFCVFPTEFSTLKDVLFNLMTFLDYSEPYFILVNSPVSLNSNNMKVTYRKKKSKCILPPSEIECFSVTSGYDFKQFKVAMQMLDHPQTKAVLSGQIVINQATGRPVCFEDVIAKVSKIIWGNENAVYLVDDWLLNFYDSLHYSDPRLDDDVIRSLDAYQEKDKPFWQVSCLGALLWFKSPYAMQFLIDFHPIYGAVLTWDEKLNQPKILEGSGGEAIVYSWDVFSHQHLDMEYTEPGTCGCCKQTLHCTKFVNVWAIKNPICSCGKPVTLEIVKEAQYYAHREHREDSCKPYTDKFPPFHDFICVHCLFNMLNNLPPEMKCGRKTCPNTDCPHHLGQKAHIRALTERRALLLPDKNSLTR